MAHTPGEWRTGRKVGRTIYANNVLIGVMDRREDAAIAAAAPGLLAALKQLVVANETWIGEVQSVIGRPVDWNDSYLDKAKAAIAKAESVKVGK